MALRSEILVGDSRALLKEIPDRSFQMCVTSPPYWGLRRYIPDGSVRLRADLTPFAAMTLYNIKDIPAHLRQYFEPVSEIGLEASPDEYIEQLVAVFREVRRTLRNDGTLWLNIGDSYTSGGRTWRDADDKNIARGMDYRAPTPKGLKPKDLIGIPWRVAFALQADGWYLRTDIVWNKPNGQPESVKDRPSRSHEYVFLLSKCERYLYNWEAMREPTTNSKAERSRRTVWSINTEPYTGCHFAAFPSELVRLCILGGSNAGSVVLDPFLGSGTTGMVALQQRRGFVGMELKEEYALLARERIASPSLQIAL